MNKSLSAQLDFLHFLQPDTHDIALIQEPHIDHLNLSRAGNYWHAVYPTHHHDNDNPSRSLILVNSRISTNTWEIVPVDSPDVTAIRIRTEQGPVYIFNVYNDQEHDRTIHTLVRRTRALQTEEARRNDRAGPRQPRLPHHIIWAGDFNRHHPLWEAPTNTHLLTNRYLDAARPLINAVAEFDMYQLLPAGEPTLQASNTKNLTRPDNIFASPRIAEALVSCKVESWMPTCTDHYPITTELDLSYVKTDTLPKWNWRDVESEVFRLAFEREMDERNFSTEPITSKEEFDKELQDLVNILEKVREEVVPKSQPCPSSKRWWNKDLANGRKEIQQLGRQAKTLQHDPNHPIHKQFRQRRNQYKDDIRKAKQEHWDSFLEDVDEESIWNFHKYLNGGPRDGGKTRVPNLKTDEGGRDRWAYDNESKAKIFHETFFLNPDDPVIFAEDHPYPPEAFEFTGFTLKQLDRAFDKLRRYKAPGIDDLPNEVYIWCKYEIMPMVLRLLQATVKLRYYPHFWQISRTCVAPKPGRSDYTLPGSWRPLALIINLAKIGSSATADILVTEAERHGLISNQHFLGRPGRTCSDSLHYLTSTIKNAWRKKQVATVLFLDVKAAFPSVNLNRLYHNMRMRGVPKTLVDWIRIRMDGRQTTLRFDDFSSDLFDIHAGLEQGCPLSVILYQFYNTPLLELATPKRGIFATGNIDDVAIIATGDSFEDTHRKLRRFMSREDGAFDWAQDHTSAFSVEKFGVLNCSRKLPKNDLGPTLELVERERERTHTIKPKKAYKFLGIMVDNKLLWREQTERALDKGLKWLATFRRMARVKTGIPMGISYRLYHTVAIPRMLYAADVFLLPQHQVQNSKRRHGSVSAIRRLSKVHRQALIMMTGGMRTTATDIMEAHTDTLPFHAIVDKHCHRATLRMATFPTSHPLQPLIHRASNRYVKRHRSALHELFKLYNVVPAHIETITPARFPPNWRAPRLQTHIDEDKDAAKETDDRWRTRNAYRIYTDGSDIDGGVGASAVLIHPQQAGPRRKKDKILKCHLGSSEQHTVYEAELVGMILGLILLTSISRWTTQKITIAVDNQSAIRAVDNTYSKPGHYLLDHFHARWLKIVDKHADAKLTIRWVPGHIGIIGNEDADVTAKSAAKANFSLNRQLPKFLRQLPQSVSRLRQSKKEELKKAAEQKWKESPRYVKMRQVDPSLTAKSYATLISSLPRRHAAILFQLRTGHAPLRKHLHTLGKVDSPICPACETAQETVTHFLFNCPAHERARRTLFYEAGRAAKCLAQLLSTPAFTRALFRYIHRTKRFTEEVGEIWMELDAEKDSGKTRSGKEKKKKKDKRDAQRDDRGAAQGSVHRHRNRIRN